MSVFVLSSFSLDGLFYSVLQAKFPPFCSQHVSLDHKRTLATGNVLYLHRVEDEWSIVDWTGQEEMALSDQRLPNSLRAVTQALCAAKRATVAIRRKSVCN